MQVVLGVHGGENCPQLRKYCMKTFWEWVAEFRLLGENYFTFDPKQYNQLFDQELEKVIARTTDPAHHQALEGMQGFNWMSYIAASVRNSGFRDQREVQERSHDIAVKLLVGGLFRDYDETRHGPMDLRFKRSVGNAIRNIVEKEKNRRHYLPTMPLDQAAEPSSMTNDDGGSEKIIQGFRNLVRKRLGGLGVAVLQVRLDGGETKSLVGCKELGSPGKWKIKQVVQQVKELLGQFAAAIGDSELLRRVARAMAAESETIEKRRKSTRAARLGVGA